MHRLVPSVLVVLGLADAAADVPRHPSRPARPVPALANTDLAIAIAVNPPLRWFDVNEDGESDAIAGSVYAGFADHHALRVNVASYAYGPNAFGEVIGAIAAGATSEASYGGRTLDVGMSYQYYPRALFDGFVLEAGVNTRVIDHHLVDEYGPGEVDTEGSGYTARALIGYSMLYDRTLLIAFGVGASRGRYTGTEIHRGESYLDEMDETVKFARWESAVEGYFRIGVVFGL